MLERERALERSLADVEELKRKLEEERATVDRQMNRMNELGRKVKEDSERLAEQARVLRAVAASSPRSPQAQIAAPTALPVSSSRHFTPASRHASPGVSPSQARVVTSPGPIQAVDDGFGAHHSPTGGKEPSSYLMSPPSFPLTETPSDLFEPEVMSLFDKYKKPLFSLWQYYCSLGSADDASVSTATPSGLDARHFVELYSDFDIAPTFLTRRELKNIFAASAKAHSTVPVSDEDAANVLLNYAGFVEALGRTALQALAKPAFQHLYPTAREKVLVLLDMWGMADARKLQEMQRKPRHKSSRRK
jgi:hypothetical protein